MFLGSLVRGCGLQRQCRVCVIMLHKTLGVALAISAHIITELLIFGGVFSKWVTLRGTVRRAVGLQLCLLVQVLYSAGLCIVDDG